MYFEEEPNMAGERYNEEFKMAAVKQVTEGGYSIADVAKRLGITTKSLYHWRDRYGENAHSYQEKQSNSDELRRLKAELKRVTEERDILKEAAVFFAAESKKNTR
jgi:transposase